MVYVPDARTYVTQSLLLLQLPFNFHRNAMAAWPFQPLQIQNRKKKRNNNMIQSRGQEPFYKNFISTAGRIVHTPLKTNSNMYAIVCVCTYNVDRIEAKGEINNCWWRS
jgi:hypothetical protein